MEKTPVEYFKVLFSRDPLRKKRKKFFDGVLALGMRSTLFGEDGEKKAAGKTILVADADREVEYCFLGSFYVEVEAPIAAADFLSGKCFLRENAPVRAPRFQALRRVAKAPSPPRAMAVATEVFLHELGSAEGLARRCFLEEFLAKQLHPHQLEGVRFLFGHLSGISRGRREGGGCVLADSMGLGKTLQVIAVLWTLLRQSPYETEGPLLRKACVVAPLSLVHNWAREIKQWLGELRLQPLVLTAQADRQELLRRAAKFAAESHRVVILSYEALLACHAELRGSVELLICDEGHRLKNPGSKLFAALDSFPTRRRVLITGTPLQNSLEELHACLRFAAGEVLGSTALFREVFVEPITLGLQKGAGEAGKRLAEERAGMLVATLRPFLLRRSEAVLARVLPPKRELIVMLELTAEQRRAQENLAAAASRQLFNVKTNKLGDFFALLGQVKRLFMHPWLHSSDKETVGLALAGLKGGEGPTLDPALSPKTLFLCRFVEEFLGHGGNEKLIVVSYSTRALDLAELLLAGSARYFRLDGQTALEKREAIVRDFSNRSDATRMLLLCAKAGGTGLNLVTATRMLILDVDWNPSNEAQVMGRIFRPGQTHPVFIYRLVVRESVEQEMLTRQLDKETLAQMVVDARTSVELFRELNEKEDLAALLGAVFGGPSRPTRKGLERFPEQLRPLPDFAEQLEELRVVNSPGGLIRAVFEKKPPPEVQQEALPVPESVEKSRVLEIKR